MENPLEQPVPEDKLAQVQTAARDLAYGAVNGFWEPTFHTTLSGKWVIHRVSGISDNKTKELDQKWQGITPPYSLLTVFGYIEKKESNSNDYQLTPKAFELLEKPFKAPSVFISYGHKQSSALSLLVEARLKNVDSQLGVFIDKSIPVGEDWHPHLEERVKDCKYFICLLGQKFLSNGDNDYRLLPTIKSPYVRQEIIWALEAGCIPIFIFHDGYRFPSEQGNLDGEIWSLIQQISQKQSIFVDDVESAEEYEFAMIKLLNALGYSTLQQQ